MDLATLEGNYSVTDHNGNDVSGSWSVGGDTTLIFTPSAALETLTLYTVSIAGAFVDGEWNTPGVQDIYGNSLYEEYVTHFTTTGNYGSSPLYFGPGPNFGDGETIGRFVDFELETLSGFEGAQGLGLNSDGSTIYASDRDGNSVKVVDAASFSISATVALPDSVEEPWQVAVKPDDSEAWVLCRGTNHVVVIETTNNTITQVIPLGASLLSSGGFLWDIIFHPDGSKAFICTRTAMSMMKVSTVDYTLKAEKALDLGAHIQGFALSPDGSKIYAGNTWGMEPSIVILASTAAMDELGTIDFTEEWGDAKFMTTHGDYLYVALRWMGIIYKIDMTTDEIVATGWAGDEPEEVGIQGIAVDPSGEVVYGIAPDEEALAMFKTDDLSFIGYLDTGGWWQIKSQ